jgi:hypothetical protein
MGRVFRIKLIEDNPQDRMNFSDGGRRRRSEFCLLITTTDNIACI